MIAGRRRADHMRTLRNLGHWAAVLTGHSELGPRLGGGAPNRAGAHRSRGAHGPGGPALAGSWGPRHRPSAMSMRVSEYRAVTYSTVRVPRASGDREGDQRTEDRGIGRSEAPRGFKNTHTRSAVPKASHTHTQPLCGVRSLRAHRHCRRRRRRRRRLYLRMPPVQRSYHGQHDKAPTAPSHCNKHWLEPRVSYVCSRQS